MPISASVSSRWSSTCVAVVGSLTAGESARIATSTRIRSANAGSWSIVRSTPSATMRPQAALEHRRRRHLAVHLRRAPTPLETKTPDRVRQDEHAVVLPRPVDEAALVDRLDRARAAAARDERRRPLGERAGSRRRLPGAAATTPSRPRCAATCARPSRRAPPRRPAAAGARRGRGRRGRARSPWRGRTPHRVMPRFGTVSGFSTRRSSEYEKMNVPISTASTAFRSPSRYQSRM